MPSGAPVPTPKVVLDLNIFVSGLLAERSGHASPPARCLGAARLATIQLLLSPGMLARLRRVLSYPKLGFSPESADRVCRDIALWVPAGGWIPDPLPAPLHKPLCPDPEDDSVLRTALAGGADFLVTGDADLLKRLTPPGTRLAAKAGLEIITAQVLVGRLSKERGL